MSLPDDTYHERRVVTLPPETRITSDVLRKLDDFLEGTDLRELREDVLELYHAYIVHEHQALPVDFERMAIRIHDLIDFLGSFPSELPAGKAKEIS